MLAEITAGLTALNALTDLGKNALDVANGDKVRAAVTAVREQLMNAQQWALDAQAREAALVKTVGQLEAKIAGFEAWEREKLRYELQELPPGIFVYAIKPEARGREPPHQLCANCYGKRIQSILNRTEPIRGTYHVRCATCGFDGIVGHRQDVKVNREPPRGGWAG